MTDTTPADEREAFDIWWNLSTEAWMRRRELDPRSIALEAWQARAASQPARGTIGHTAPDNFGPMTNALKGQPAQEPVLLVKAELPGREGQWLTEDGSYYRLAAPPADDEAVRKDAERYRWLIADVGRATTLLESWELYSDGDANELDAAIDAALEAEVRKG